MTAELPTVQEQPLRGKRAAARDAVLQRRERVALLLAERASVRQIASAFTVSIGTAHADIEAVREEWKRRSALPLDRLAAEELARLDHDEQKLRAERATCEGSAMRLAYSDRILKIQQERAKRLGLYAPERHAHGGDSDAPPVTVRVEIVREQNWRFGDGLAAEN